MFSFTDWVSFGERERGGEGWFGIGRPSQRGGRILNVDGKGGWGVLEIGQFS